MIDISPVTSDHSYVMIAMAYDRTIKSKFFMESKSIVRDNYILNK